MALLARGWEPGVRHRGYGVIEIILVAADACGAGDVEIVIDVAVCTLPRRNRVRTRQRKTRFRMIESRRLPGCGGVAGFASLGESPAHVIRVRGSLEILQVTRHAGRAGQVVVVVDVTVRALARRHGMRTGQNESGRGVIELAIGPGHRVVTLLAGGRESGMRHRRRRRVVVGLVATDTGGRGDVVIVVDVTIRAQAWRHGVRTRQNKSGRRVVELAVGPGHSVVTLLARSREPGVRNRRSRRVAAAKSYWGAYSRLVRPVARFQPVQYY